jgi:hypothetical protein
MKWHAPLHVRREVPPVRIQSTEHLRGLLKNKLEPEDEGITHQLGHALVGLRVLDPGGLGVDAYGGGWLRSICRQVLSTQRREPR